MTDTTITTHLEELREVDADTYREIQKRLLHYMIAPQMDAPIVLDHIQGCIQRAIAGRIKTGTFAGYMLLYDLMGCEATITMGKEHDYDDIEERADTPAAAILAAYIEAKRAMR